MPKPPKPRKTKPMFVLQSILSSRQKFDPAPVVGGKYKNPLIRLSPKDIDSVILPGISNRRPRR
jgi:hypothetical protein